jgi:modulator of FtsH protease
MARGTGAVCHDAPVTAYAPDAWDSFFVAQAGASAALAGLLFVGVSINLREIVADGRLSRRAAEALLLLVQVLLLSAVLLVPDASTTALGWGVLGISLIIWGMVTIRHAQIVSGARRRGDGPAPRGSVFGQVLLGQLATIPFLVGSVTLLAEAGGGLWWFAPGVVFAYVAALLDAWVLLVEIQR